MNNRCPFDILLQKLTRGTIQQYASLVLQIWYWIWYNVPNYRSFKKLNSSRTVFHTQKIFEREKIRGQRHKTRQATIRKHTHVRMVDGSAKS
jgi:hypothetical protein